MTSTSGPAAHPYTFGLEEEYFLVRRNGRRLRHVLDVRDEYEWDEKHIPGAVRRYVGHLEDDLPPWPKDTEIVVHCNVGHRSGLACSILKRAGFSRIHNMLGGITAWEKLELPLELSDEAKKKKAKEEEEA